MSLSSLSLYNIHFTHGTFKTLKENYFNIYFLIGHYMVLLSLRLTTPFWPTKGWISTTLFNTLVRSDFFFVGKGQKLSFFVSLLWQEVNWTFWGWGGGHTNESAPMGSELELFLLYFIFIEICYVYMFLLEWVCVRERESATYGFIFKTMSLSSSRLYNIHFTNGTFKTLK